MDKKLLLTSVFALGFAAPAALADTANVFDAFPEDGIMLLDSEYVDAATLANMGVDSGNVYAVAQFRTASYDVPAGEYLPSGSSTTTGCENGYYCPGGTGINYSTTSAQGRVACPSGYTQSDPGARGRTQCYKSCTVTDIAHAATVIGKDYYGSADTCEPSSCANGWHLKPYESGVKSGTEVLAAIGDSNGVNSAYVDGGGSLVRCTDADAGCSGSYDAAYYNLSTTAYRWSAVYNSSFVVFGSSARVDDTCGCRVTGYSEAGHSYNMTSPLVSTGVIYSDADECARVCASYMREYAYHSFRSSILEATVPELTSCEVNTINIKWYNTTLDAVSANNAGSVKYGESIFTPQYVPDSMIPEGKVFLGWKFSTAPSATQTLANP